MMNLPEEPEHLYVYEQLARADGYQKVIGIDEAGRGPLAGPVVVAAVHLPSHKRFDQLNDSKQLSEKQREALYPPLTEDPEIEWSKNGQIGWIAVNVRAVGESLETDEVFDDQWAWIMLVKKIDGQWLGAGNASNIAE